MIGKCVAKVTHDYAFILGFTFNLGLCVGKLAAY
ncbi:hypothetical protein DET47_10548 [Shewanella putrefaciens]|mgnify:CR=1 FL=1|jgi:hypothetical protein|nr:hypothetical protein DET47_10548 [Shewanella putrefaciens]